MDVSDATLPIKLPAFDLQGVNPDNIIDFTPALKQTALQLLEATRSVQSSHASRGDRTRWIEGPGPGAWLQWRRRTGNRVLRIPKRDLCMWVRQPIKGRSFDPKRDSYSDARVDGACCDSDYLMGARTPASERLAADEAALRKDHGPTI